MLRFALIGVLASSPVSLGAPCEAPRSRDVAPLVEAIAQDKAMARAFLEAAQACQLAESDACDAARLACGDRLAKTLRAQVDLDDGAWLRDMMLPYDGLTYPASRAFQAGAQAMDTACTGDAAQLMSASSRRALQAARRQGLVDEYPRYARWVSEQARGCRERAPDGGMARGAPAERDAGVARPARGADGGSAEGEGLTAAGSREAVGGAAPRPGGEAPGKVDEAAAARLAAVELAERRAKAQLEESERAQREAAAREAQAAAAERAERQARAQLEETERAQRAAREEAERKAREDAERSAVKTREARKQGLRARKEALERQAAVAEQRAREIAAMSFSADQASQAAQLQAERLQAAAKARALRDEAAAIVDEDGDERPRGSFGLMGGGGATTWPGAAAGALGGQALFHFGFWGTAPADGIASGLELRGLVRFLSTLEAVAAQQAEGLVTARAFIGRVGLGGAAELRWGRLGPGAGSITVGFGPSLALAFVDTPRSRVLLSATWLPVTQRGVEDLTRVLADLELSYDFLVVDVAGGTQRQVSPATGADGITWTFGVFVGARLRW
ncbi:MAG: hypothetical protein INH41_07060 [Myxococcaceae bacterium]|jgi:hypothetical protein|nr:hypothetical protein [Myxococcaceae bacterium]